MQQHVIVKIDGAWSSQYQIFFGTYFITFLFMSETFLYTVQNIANIGMCYNILLVCLSIIQIKISYQNKTDPVYLKSITFLV